MKEKNDINEEKQEEKQVLKKASLAIFISVLLLFAAIIFVVFLVEHFWGKTVGTVALVILAIIIACSLYRKEIADFFKKKANK